MAVESNLRVSPLVRDKLSKLKKKYSYDEYINIMVDYFLATNIKPESETVSHIQTVTKEIERVIKILKSQEKEYDKPMLKLLKDVHKSTTKTLSEFSQEHGLDEELTAADFELLVKNMETLKTENSTLRGNNLKLTQEVEYLKINERQVSESDIDVKVIEGCCEEIIRRMKKGDYDITGYINRIQQCISK